MSGPRVYVETSIISYLVGWLNRSNHRVAANQELTREWWTTRRQDFELFASGVVIDEASHGDGALAAERLLFLTDIRLLEVSPDSLDLRARLIRETRIPAKAEIDALHIAVAAVHGMDYLLTWNCTHIANAIVLPKVYDVCRLSGFEPPLICTPPQLMENQDEPRSGR
jgi:hypothetical protein